MGFILSIVYLTVICAGYLASVAMFGLLFGSVAWVLVAVAVTNLVWKLH